MVMSDNDFELAREIRGLSGDLNMTKMAIENVQREMKEMLDGEMGKDMKDVLEGKKSVTVSTVQKHKFKLRNWFKKLFLRF